MLKAKLRTVGGSDAKNEIGLHLPATIGRGRENEIALNHPLVSRQHCQIYEQDGMLRVRDLGSLNGTYIGRDRIEDHILYPGDLLTVGSFTFRAIYGDYDESMAVIDDEELEAQSTVDGEVLADTGAGATSLKAISDTPLAAEQTVPITEAEVDTAKVSEARSNTTIQNEDSRKPGRKNR